ncbi:hypothetical protein GIB67_005704 [Kingdonia uniflora]|uniref:RING-type E3 ubiquitin transferase n=1 Tax=Kingdonia uniflora TaxID=39325 RepID=A0A7J7NIV0_9MAGN|nr:hypothetical protein GIB67_005704 [Kingdonia uniflora]
MYKMRRKQIQNIDADIKFYQQCSICNTETKDDRVDLSFMAMSSRTQRRMLLQPNQKFICPPVCIGCPIGCTPEYALSPPPPPYPIYPPYHPLPPPPPPSSIPFIFIVLITVATFGGSFAILASCYVILIKTRLDPNASGEENLNLPLPANIGDENHIPVMAQAAQPSGTIINVDSSGLDQSYIDTIAICKYNKGDGLVEATECSVCLYEFQVDEILRIMPNCVHAFHVPCIDTWLKLHTDCPLCRARVNSDDSPVVASSMNAD